MATSPKTIDSLMDILAQAPGGAGPVSARKMFGEYALYFDGKVVALICDDTVYLKPTPGALALVETPREGFPYPGAKPHLVIGEELDDPDRLARLMRAVAADLPPSKPKAPRKTRS